MSVSGTPDRLRGVASLSLPEGVERLPERGQRRVQGSRPPHGERCRRAFGWTGRCAGIGPPAGRAGGGPGGGGDPPRRPDACGFAGPRRSLPGRAEEYGFRYPVSWKGMAGEWEVSGPWIACGRRLPSRSEGLAAWSLPPVPVTVKVDGVPAEALRLRGRRPGGFVQGDRRRNGTVPHGSGQGPNERVGFSAREIDLADSGNMGLLRSRVAGEGPGRIREYLDGTKRHGGGRRAESASPRGRSISRGAPGRREWSSAGSR